MSDPSFIPSWETIQNFIVSLGWVKGVFAIFFFIAHFWIYWLYNGRLKDRQAEINRLAADNREYRERFIELLDKQFDYHPNVTEADKVKELPAPKQMGLWERIINVFSPHKED